MRKITASLKGKIGEIIFDRGRKYFEREEGVITLVISDGEFLVIEGEYKEGKTKVITSITVDQRDGDFFEGHCDCLDYENRKNICRHVVALGMQGDITKVVREIIGTEEVKMTFGLEDEFDLIEEKILKKANNNKLKNKITIKKVRDIKEITEKNIGLKSRENIKKYDYDFQELYFKLVKKDNKSEFFTELEMDEASYSDYRYGYDYMQEASESSYVFRLKVGTDKIFYVKDLFKFLSALAKGEKFVVTTKLEYDPDKHYFNEDSAKILLKMYEYYLKLDGVSIIRDKKGIKITEEIYEGIMDIYPFGKKINILDRDAKKTEKHEPLFVDMENGLEIRDIFQHIDRSRYFFLGTNKNNIYKMKENERNFLDELNILNIRDIENIILNERGKFFQLLKKYNIKCGKYSEEFGKIEIYIQSIKGSRNLKVKILEGVESIYSKGNYYIPKINESLMEKLSKYIEKISLENVENNVLQEYIIDYDGLHQLSKLIESDYNNNVKIHLDSEIKKPRNISISMGIKKRSNNLLDFSFNIDGVEKEEVELIVNEIKNNKRFILLSSGELVKIVNENIEDMAEIIGVIGGFKVGDNKISKIKALQLSQISKDIKDRLEEIEEFRKIFKQIKEKKEDSPKGINAKLFPYQKFGFNWLKNMYDVGLGCVLADDMGLGKTLQTISMLSEIMDKNKNFFGLIVVPTSLLHNWKEEILKFSSIKPILVEGVFKKRREIIKKSKKGILITTYQALRNDIEDYKEKEFSIVILDEAQNIKTATSQIKKAVMKLNSNVNIALTGTPVENNILELWSIFDFVLPGYLDTLNKFKKKYKEVLTDSKSKKIEKLRNVISPFILRRTKQEVLTQLPDKFETNLVVQLSTEQRALYMSYVKRAKREISKFDKRENNRIKILAILTKLRQICNSPVLFKEDYNGEIAKIEVLKDLLPDIIENEHRLLIFSQFVGTLKEVEKELEDKEIEYFYIDGGVASKERLEICNRFNSGERQVVLISLKAGGTGLNLVGADVVIHYDPWWNIAVENQASDRAYRIGQKNSVQVIKLVTEGTIEEKILKIQENKRMLSESLIEGKGGEKLFEMSDEELLDLLL